MKEAEACEISADLRRAVGEISHVLTGKGNAYRLLAGPLSPLSGEDVALRRI